MQNSVISARNTSLYGSQTSPVNLCMQNSVPSIRITSLYGSQPSSVVLCIQKRAFRSRIACLYRSHHSSADLCIQKSDFRTLVACLHGSKPHLCLCACKTACLASELLVSMGSSTHLWFLDAKQRLWNRITSLYGSQT